MALISPFTIIRSVSLFHLTAAYFFLTNPRMIADQNVVYMLGESMQLPHVTMDKPNEASAFIAVLLGFFGLADLTAASLNEETALEYWLSNVPMRLLSLFGVAGYVYLFKDDGMFGNKSMLKAAGPGDNLKNSLVFGWAFMETCAWFWVFLSLRDERREAVRRRMEKLKAEEDRL